jgi:hypothetical protein
MTGRQRLGITTPNWCIWSDAPRTNKWLTASVVDDAATVVGQVFDEADRRDPRHQRTWVALVDGNNHQINRIHAEAAARDIDITILCDFVHVLEYLWKAAWSFHHDGDPATEQWVHDKAMAVLEGKARHVAAGIRRSATRRGLGPPERAGADACAPKPSSNSAPSAATTTSMPTGSTTSPKNDTASTNPATSTRSPRPRRSLQESRTQIVSRTMRWSTL